MELPNAQGLYDFIKKNNVKKVLDLGTGIGASAAVMALAFKDKGVEDYHIDSIDQYDKCLRLANELIPEDLKKNTTFYKRDPVVWSSDEMPYQPLSVYDSLPEGDYDLIVNDGPAPFMENGKYIDLPNGTIHKLNLENKLKSNTFVVYDGRISSLQLLERYFANNFLYVHIPPRGSDFSVLQRDESPLKIVDEKFESLNAQSSYFKNHNVVEPETKKEEPKEKPKHEDTLPVNQPGPSSKAGDTTQGVS